MDETNKAGGYVCNESLRAAIVWILNRITIRSVEKTV